MFAGLCPHVRSFQRRPYYFLHTKQKIELRSWFKPYSIQDLVLQLLICATYFVYVTENVLRY